MQALGRRFALVYACLGLTLGGAAYLGWTAATSAGTGARCGGPWGSADPILTAVNFIHSTVERTNPAAGYRLVTNAARQGISCSSWAHGRIPFAAYRDVDWDRSAYRAVAAGTGQLVLRVTLRSRLHRPAAEAFMLELRQDGPLWQVGFWAPARG
jgi:hypothetical protein